jgi:hypothetical protein
VVGRDAEVDGGGAAGDERVDLGELGVSGGEADLESFGFAGPAFAFGLGDAGGEVVADRGQPGPLVRVDPQERAADAPLTELTTMFQQFTARFRSLALTCPRDRIG